MAIRLPSAWKDELLARTDIVSVVSSYVTLKKDGRRYWGLCPFHNEKTPSFSVNADLNMYYCFGCKATGDAIRFVMEMERAPFMDAVKILADRAHMTLPELQEDPDYERRRSQRERLLSANREAARYYHDTLWKPEGKAVLDYLHNRGLTDGVIRRFGLGASTDQWDGLTAYLTEKGYTREELNLAGLTVIRNDNVFDMFRSRAMFPIIDQYNHVLGFGGRALQKDAKPKYLNTTDTPVFNKRKGVYAINLIRKNRDLKRLILVEGYMDVVAISQAGVTGAVATLGTALTNEQARLLGRYAPEVYLCYDGDEAGQHAIERGLDILESEGVSCRVLYLPDGLDPDEFIRQRGLEAFEAIRPMRPTAYRMERLKLQYDLQSQDGKTEYAKQCAALLRRVKDPVDLDNYLESLALQTGFSKEVLLAQIGSQAQKARNDAPVLSPLRDEPARTRQARQPDGYKTEQTLLALLATGKLPPGMVKETDFISDNLRLIAGRLIAGETPDSIVSNEDLTDDARQTAGEAFSLLTGAETENAAEVAEDCLRKIRIRYLEQEMNKLKESMRTLESDEQKMQMLTEIQKLSKELGQLKQQGR
ncbi:MAG: DNA primase [Clostridia bacterium]|nr:DNA primase [Clostridia bacterium]